MTGGPHDWAEYLARGPPRDHQAARITLSEAIARAEATITDEDSHNSGDWRGSGVLRQKQSALVNFVGCGRRLQR